MVALDDAEGFAVVVVIEVVGNHGDSVTIEAESYRHGDYSLYDKNEALLAALFFGTDGYDTLIGGDGKDIFR